MYVIRDVVHCKPGNVRQMMEKFRVISGVMKDGGQEPLRLLTDISGERFWTIIAEAQVDNLDDFFAMLREPPTNENLRKTMADYLQLVEGGRREIYRIES